MPVQAGRLQRRRGRCCSSCPASPSVFLRRLSPRRRFQAFARAAIDGGVDVIHGHSAHVVQGVEIYKGRPILYDTGNFVDDYWKFPFLPDVSFVFLLDLQVGGPQRLRMVPIRLHPAPLRIATAARSSTASVEAAPRSVPSSWNVPMG
jgi:hypothetical protein